MMKKAPHFLILPRNKAASLGIPARQRLSFTTDHRASHYGLGVMLKPNDKVLTGARFQRLRDTFGARIKTDQPAKVCAALGLPLGEPGIKTPKEGTGDRS